jgi:hypothetical protein
MCFVSGLPIEATFHVANSFALVRKSVAFDIIFKGSEFVKSKGEDPGCMSDEFALSQWSSVILEKVVKK